VRRPKADPKGDLDMYLQHGGFGRVEREFKFHPVRKWRFDWFLPDQTSSGCKGIAVEYDGFLAGRRAGPNVSHSGVENILRDSEKINEAQAMGIRVFRANAKNCGDGTFYELLSKVLVSPLEASIRQGQAALDLTPTGNAAHEQEGAR
jgi:hypothetical protein